MTERIPRKLTLSVNIATRALLTEFDLLQDVVSRDKSKSFTWRHQPL